MQPIKRIASVLALFSMTSMNCHEAIDQASVLVCYGDVNPDKIQGYKYVILESEHFNAFDVQLIQENNELILGYISLGEVSTSRYYYDQLKDRTAGKNPIWDSYYLNLNDPTTQSVIMGLVDKIQKKGFNGLFLDTVDVFGPWGPQSDQVGSYVSFISLIKEKYPDLHLMQNAGLPIVPRVKDFISSVAIESVVTDYNFEKEDYRMRKISEYHKKMTELKTLHKNYNLPVILIEYADSKTMFNKVKNQLSNQDWDYFIGNIGLDNFPKFK